MKCLSGGSQEICCNNTTKIHIYRVVYEIENID